MPKETPDQRKKVFWSPWKVHFIAQFDFYKIWHLKSLALPHPSIERLSNFYIFSLWPLFYLDVVDGNHFVLIVTPSPSQDHFFVPFGFAETVKSGEGLEKMLPWVDWWLKLFGWSLFFSCCSWVVLRLKFVIAIAADAILWLSLALFWKCCWNEQRVVWTERFQSLPAVFTQKLHDVATCVFPVFQLRSICPRFSRTHAVFAARTFSKLNWLDSTFARLVLWNASLNCSKESRL